MKSSGNQTQVNTRLVGARYQTCDARKRTYLSRHSPRIASGQSSMWRKQEGSVNGSTDLRTAGTRVRREAHPTLPPSARAIARHVKRGCFESPRACNACNAPILELRGLYEMPRHRSNPEFLIYRKKSQNWSRCEIKHLHQRHYYIELNILDICKLTRNVANNSILLNMREIANG